MSREKLTIVEKSAITQRFIEVCGSEEPVFIKQLLKISYQAARNYVNGRLPTTEILVAIAEYTPYSIHWLLTGQGDKFVGARRVEDTQLLTGAMRASVREVCVEVFQELTEAQKAAGSKVVTLGSNKVKSEKTVDAGVAAPENVRKDYFR
jgi:hypothetical protein